LESGKLLKGVDSCAALDVQIFIKSPKLYANAPGDLSRVAEFSLESGELVREFVGHSDDVNALFATSKRLFSGSKDGTVREWSLDSGICTRTFPDHCPSTFGTGFLVTTEFLYNGSSKGPDINEWSLSTGQIVRTFSGHDDEINGLAILSDRLYSASTDTTIKEWSLESGLCLRTFEGHTDTVWKLAIMQK